MNISVPTSQNVTIEYEVANIGARIGAFFLDMLVIIGYFIYYPAVLQGRHSLKIDGADKVS